MSSGEISDAKLEPRSQTGHENRWALKPENSSESNH